MKPLKTDLLVTGGGGLFGYALKEICPRAAYVSSRDYDLTDNCRVQAMFEKFRPEKVIHLAAKVAGVKTNAEKIADMFTVNAQINTNVLAAAQAFGVRKLVAVLSNCVFKEHPEAPPTEKDIHKDMPYHGHLGYGYAKRMLDLQIHLLHKQYGCKFTSVTPVTIFGPNDNWKIGEGHVVGSLIHKCYLAKKTNAPFEIWGSGNAVRQFIYSHDMARILLETLDKYDGQETIIIAPDGGTSIRTLAETIAKAMDFRGNMVFEKDKPEGESVRVLNNAKFKSLFPDFKFTPLEDALRSTVRWFQDNYSRMPATGRF